MAGRQVGFDPSVGKLRIIQSIPVATASRCEGYEIDDVVTGSSVDPITNTTGIATGINDVAAFTAQERIVTGTAIKGIVAKPAFNLDAAIATAENVVEIRAPHFFDADQGIGSAEAIQRGPGSNSDAVAEQIVS